MISIENYKVALAITALFATSATFAGTMTDTEYANAKNRISINYKADKAVCESFSGNAEDVCEKDASGKENVARAQLESDYSGKTADANKVSVAEADSTYATAKQLCDEKAGDAKEVCMTEAKATHTAGLANSKVTKAVSDASEDAVEDVSDADYAAAKAKCESLAGTAKDSCINTAKVRFGKD